MNKRTVWYGLPKSTHSVMFLICYFYLNCYSEGIVILSYNRLMAVVCCYKKFFLCIFNLFKHRAALVIITGYILIGE